MPKVTIVRYEYHEGDGHDIQLFLDGKAVWAGQDQDNGRVEYADLLGALGFVVEEVGPFDDTLPTGPLESDYDPEYYGYDQWAGEDGVTYTGVNKQ